jgi:hypothetical protein
MISARPPEIRSTWANCSKTRTGSSEERTVTALESRICCVCAANRGEGGGRGRDEVVGAMVLADREDLQPQVVGEAGLLEEVAHPLLGADARIEVGEGDESKIHTR